MGTIIGSSCGGSAVDDYIIEACGKEHPRALFIPTPCSDSFGAMNWFNDTFNKTYGCTTDFLLLLNENITEEYIEEKIMAADIINVPGGSAAFTMSWWHHYNMPKYIKAAYDKGAVLSGASAGSICWFKYGNGDSNIFKGEDNRMHYRKVEGTGLINAINYPHYHPGQDWLFEWIMKQYDIPAIALEDGCTFIEKDGQYKIMKSRETVDAYKITKDNNGKLVKEVIDNTEFKNLNELLKGVKK